MIQKQWNDSRLRDVLQKKAVAARRPLSCTFELTYRCNFNCQMCYVRMTDRQAAPFGRMRTVQEWLDMAGQLRDAGVLYLNLTGGECTQYPGFAELYEKLYGMGFRLTVMSNAGAYTDAIRELFRQYPPYGAAITLYGGSNETYAAVTGDPKGLDKTVANIRFLQSLGVPISLNFTMIRQNVLDYPKVGRLCMELGLPYTLITDITGHQKDASFSNALTSRLSPAQRACIACHPPEEVALALENAEALEKELADFKMPAAPAAPQEPTMNACIGSYSGCAIFWNGEMQTCISMNGWHTVNPFEIGFEAAWQKIQSEHAETFRTPAACQACDLFNDCLHNCAARRFEGTRNPGEPDPYTCQYTYLLTRYRARRNNPEIPAAPSCP